MVVMGQIPEPSKGARHKRFKCTKRPEDLIRDGGTHLLLEVYHYFSCIQNGALLASFFIFSLAESYGATNNAGFRRQP